MLKCPDKLHFLYPVIIHLNEMRLVNTTGADSDIVLQHVQDFNTLVAAPC